MTASSDIVAQIARAVLYEGYILWPYRRSAMKNQQRWTFGGVYPREYAANSGGADRSTIRADVLFEPATCDARIDVSLCFLQIVARQAVAMSATGQRTPVPELVVDDQYIVCWDEATERVAKATIAAEPHASVSVDVHIPASREEEFVRRSDGSTAGVIVRSWSAIDAVMTVRTSAAVRDDGGDGHTLRRVTVDVDNRATWKGSDADREGALRHTLASAHLILHSEHGEFLSTEDPPSGVDAATNALCNDGVWPTLVGECNDRHTLLASPIILGDYPRIAPESSGDFFDGGEIDQLLVLNVLALTTEEQLEMEATDPQAREILERCRTLTPTEALRLHATMRRDRFAAPPPLKLLKEERA